jgi:hypothetical protein
LFAVLVIAGLALAPAARPVMAGTSTPASELAMADEMTPSEMSSPEMSASVMADEMASDMPCCPSKAPAPIDCDKCVFMSACMSKCFTGMTATVFHPFPIASDRIGLQRNDARPDGFGHPPPEHPPRSLV